MSIETHGPVEGRHAEVLTGDALAFVAHLHERFNERREELIARRAERVARWNAGSLPDFLDDRREVREGDWQVAPPPPDLRDRRVEITGPADRKMVINALNSGARGFMADFEDSLSPTWSNVVQGHVNLTDAIEGTIEHEENGKTYSLGEERATLLVRPRGWHLTDRHVTVGGRPVSASLMDFGLHLFHNAKRLLERGSGPYFYLPKMESHLEARLWNEVFVEAQERLGLERGTIRATVLIETVPAAFEMEEILYELRDHSAGLNAGRWDYMFSVVKTFRTRGEEFLLPDRNSVTMTVPFMRAYTELLVRTCHKRGAHAIGGMAAFIPSKDPAVNEQAFAKVRADKEREANDGFDGSWVAHPGMVELCKEVFTAVLGERPNQIDKKREDVHVTAEQLLDVRSTPGETTEAGLRSNISVGIQYIESWLRGSGAVGINNLMEDAATAEISRSQVWQWLHNGVRLAGGETVTRELVERIVGEEMDAIRQSRGDAFSSGRWDEARDLFVETSLADEYPDFLTLPAYERMP
ncbi:MAG TPA: malate synthase A [Thermoleophilaceae bacterium]